MHIRDPDGSPQAGGEKKKDLPFQARLFFKASTASAPCIRQIHNREEEKEGGESGNRLTRGEERRGVGEDRKGGEQRKGGKAEGGSVRVGVVRKKSRGEVGGREGEREHSESNADTRSPATLF